MLNILQLPQEILHTICQYLTTKDKYCLYDTCTIFRNVIISRALNKKIVLSLSTLATFESLKLDYIKNVYNYIEELDMSGVCDLTKTNLIPCLNRMKNLKSLNVAYTNIVIPDLLDAKLRTNIKKLTINFNFSKDYSEIEIPLEILQASQNFFEDIEYVHFVGSGENLLYSRLPTYILMKSKKDLIVKFTIIKNFYGTVYANDMDLMDDFTFKHLSIGFPVLIDTDDLICETNVPNFTNFKLFDFKNFEYILILKSSANLMHVSERFKTVLSKHFDIVSNSISHLPFLEFKYNSVFWFWDKSNTFDELFFNNLIYKIQGLFPNYIRYFEYNKPLLIRNGHSKWFNAKPLVLKTYRSDKLSSSSSSPPSKKQRIGLDSFLLDFDDVLQKDNNIKLNLNFGPTLLNFTLKPDLNYLRKITVLSIVGNYLYSPDFFQILFERCINLITFNLGYSPKCSPSRLILKSIHLSHSLRNVKMVDSMMDFETLFKSLSEVKNLESIYITDRSYGNNYTLSSDLVHLLSECEKLYSIFIHAVICHSTKSKIVREFAKLKNSLDRHYLTVDINNDRDNHTDSEYLNPFLKFLR